MCYTNAQREGKDKKGYMKRILIGCMAAALVAGCGVLAYFAQSCFSISMPMITPFLWALIAVVNSQHQPLAKRRSK